VGCLSALVLAASPARAQATCEEVGTPAGGTVTLRIEVDAPAPGTVFEVSDACRLRVQATGSFTADADFALDHDFYLVLDASASAANDSGVDVDGNGSPGDIPGDSIFNAEVTAAIRFVDALDPTASRVAVIGFSSSPTLHEPLTADLARVRATLTDLLTHAPGGGTIYSAALDEVHAQASTLGDLADRVQRALFLSDGNPNQPDRPLVHPAALRLADLGVRVDTFALDVPTADALEDVAATTGGEFHQLDAIGDVLDVLPQAADDLAFDFTCRNGATGEPGRLEHDAETGTFTAALDLAPGRNELELRIEVPSRPPVVLTCPLELELRVTPGPSSIGPSLRLHRPSEALLLLDWQAASNLDLHESDLVLRSDRPNGGFAPLALGLTDRQLLEPLPTEPLLFFDVRRAKCQDVISED
jgi:hypothetical protein